MSDQTMPSTDQTLELTEAQRLDALQRLYNVVQFRITTARLRGDIQEPLRVEWREESVIDPATGETHTVGRYTPADEATEQALSLLAPVAEETLAALLVPGVNASTK